MIDQFVAERLLKVLGRIEQGRLDLELPDGRRETFSGAHPGLHAGMQIADWGVFRHILSRGDLGLMETYRDGRWSTPDLTALLSLGLHNASALGPVLEGGLWSRCLARLQYLLRSNTLSGSRKNIHAHYDIGNAFYALWLDPGMTYSAALFERPEQDLERAQTAKYQRIVDCLEADSGSLLEIGCGWGGFAAHALERGDYQLRGLTLSTEQLDYARHRLGQGADMALQDYRNESGLYDRIVSIEMFEAVGERYWPTYFSKLGSLLRRGGKAVVQTITIDDARFERYRRSADVIRTYIFPGGMLPSPQRFTAAAREQGLRVGESFHFGEDYARTLEVWLANFEQRSEAVRQLGFDEAFVRIWRFYLACCIATFRSGSTSVMQVELDHA